MINFFNYFALVFSLSLCAQTLSKPTSDSGCDDDQTMNNVVLQFAAVAITSIVCHTYTSTQSANQSDAAPLIIIYASAAVAITSIVLQTVYLLKDPPF
jgi:hypothetical protein